MTYIQKFKSEFLILLVFINLLAFTFAGYYYFGVKMSFYDDCFIYLHMASNIVESGSAQYFQPSGLINSQLLASSPMHLYFETIAAAIVQIINDNLRTLESAKLILILNGLLMSFFFTIFWRAKDFQYYLIVSIIFWLLVPTFDSMIEMEGGLLFFVFTAFAYRLYIFESTQKDYLVFGILLGILMLSRIEIFVVAFVALSFLILLNKTKLDKNILVGMYGLLGVVALHIVLSYILNVYPLPSTIWSKQVTGQIHLFDSHTFLEVLPSYIQSFTGIQIKLLFLILSALTILLCSRKVIISIGIFVTLMLLVYHKLPANFTWYYQNAYLTILMIFMIVSIQHLKNRRSYSLAFTFSSLILLITLPIISKYYKDPGYEWDFSAKQSRAISYQYIAAHHLGNGIYKFPDFLPAYIRNPEIGIIAFFSGRTSWMYDMAGLAQIGNLNYPHCVGLEKVKTSSQAYKTPLKYFYPNKFQISGEEELKQLKSNSLVLDVWGVERNTNIDQALKNCFYFDGKICINKFRE